MVAEKIDGTAVARKIRDRINEEIVRKQKTDKRFRPALTIVQGERFSTLSLRGLYYLWLDWCFFAFLFVEQKFIWSTIANIIPNTQLATDLIHVRVTVSPEFGTTRDVVIRSWSNSNFSLLS